MHRLSSLLGRHSWRTPILKRVDIQVLTALAIWTAAGRGMDYLTLAGPPPAAVEQVMPPRWGGAWFLTGAVILALGCVAGWHRVRWFGFTTLAIAYLGLAVGLIGSLARGNLDGIRTGNGLLFPVAFHTIMALRTGFTLLSPDAEEATGGGSSH